ncbi:transcription factor ovo 2 [Echinococcus multilocularis]|uniref:Transcription factor ovo 2 n=1 Tax=Echinococcus multilocularis TaxID=6211 RepID=U6HB71_ECHMU|nr:transcription factor ovo 2 [Echinococcus multilocularis]
MSQGRDTKRPESLEELLDEENVAPNAPSGSPREKSGGEKRVLETLISAQEDEAGHLAEVKEMLKNNDPRLKFVLDGDAIENPFAVDQEAQLQYLMDSFCEMKVDGGHKCVVCDDEWEDLEMMHQHLLTHSNSKFYLCVCFASRVSTHSLACTFTQQHTMMKVRYRHQFKITWIN